MGTAASVEKATKSTNGNSGYGVYGQEVIRTSSSQSEGAGGTFCNVIDTTLQFSQVEASAASDTTIKAKVYKKSEAVRNLIRTALKKTFIFRSLTSVQLESVINVFSPFTCVVGETIINQGAAGEYM
jgi:hypothetical protein